MVKVLEFLSELFGMMMEVVRILGNFESQGVSTVEVEIPVDSGAMDKGTDIDVHAVFVFDVGHTEVCHGDGERTAAGHGWRTCLRQMQCDERV